MRNATKLLAFVLAFVMVLSMVPMASAQTVHTHGIEEYPEIFANEEVLVSIGEHTCSSCKWTEQRISEPTGHIWDEGTVNENGETVYTCRICGATTGELPFVNPFTDVNEDDWFYDSVVWAVKGGITNGISETEFASPPTATVPRPLPSCTVPWLTDLP